MQLIASKRSEEDKINRWIYGDQTPSSSSMASSQERQTFSWRENKEEFFKLKGVDGAKEGIGTWEGEERKAVLPKEGKAEGDGKETAAFTCCGESVDALDGRVGDDVRSRRERRE